jgi:hypothetical protein
MFEAETSTVRLIDSKMVDVVLGLPYFNEWWLISKNKQQREPRGCCVLPFAA